MQPKEWRCSSTLEKIKHVTTVWILSCLGQKTVNLRQVAMVNAHSTLTFFNAEHQTGKLWNMDAIFKFLPSMTLDNG